MSPNFYTRDQQKIGIVHEQAYGQAQEESSQWDAITADNASVNYINVIPTGIEVPLPKINKIKKYDIGNLKHASHVASGNRDPITFTMDLEVITPVFLAYAVGTATTSGSDPYTHALSEGTGSSIESFTLHCEQEHGGDDDIYYDLHGCVVDEYSLSINKGDETVRESVTIKCPHTSYPGNAVSSFNSPAESELYTFNDLKGSATSSDEVGITTTLYLIGEQGQDTDLTPDAVESVNLIISNNINFLPNIGQRYMAYAIPTVRNVSMSISGFISDRTLMTYWEEVWDAANDRPNSASGSLCSAIYLERGTSDYIFIPVAYWMLNEHSVEFASIEDGIKGVDLTFEDAIPDGSASGKIFYDPENTTDGIEIKDGNDNSWYHNTT